jgi:auxin response factor
MSFTTHHVPCAPQTAEVAPFQSSNARRFLANARDCMLSGPTSRLAMHNSGFTYQSVGFSESNGFSEVLQGQEISQAIPMFQGMMSEACSVKGRYGRHGFTGTGMSSTVNGLSAEAQEVSLTLSTSPSSQVPSSYPQHVLNQTVISQLGLAIKADSCEGANSSQRVPFGMQWENRSRIPYETPGQVSLEQFETRRASAPGDAAKLGGGVREVRKTSCRLFGFSLTEKVLPADNDCVKDRNFEAECSNPRMLDLLGYNCSTPGAVLLSQLSVPLP